MSIKTLEVDGWYELTIPGGVIVRLTFDQMDRLHSDLYEWFKETHKEG